MISQTANNLQCLERVGVKKRQDKKQASQAGTKKENFNIQ